MMSVRMFCMPGGHSVEVVVSPDADLSKYLPPGWTLTKASCVTDPTVGPSDDYVSPIWYEDPSSAASVLCCPDHQLVSVKRQ
jgi:hypothetical protein